MTDLGGLIGNAGEHERREQYVGLDFVRGENTRDTGTTDATTMGELALYINTETMRRPADLGLVRELSNEVGYIVPRIGASRVGDGQVASQIRGPSSKDWRTFSNITGYIRSAVRLSRHPETSREKTGRRRGNEGSNALTLEVLLEAAC